MSKNWQVQATMFAKTHDLLHTPEAHALDLVSEMGEVAKELLLATDYGKRPFQPSLSRPHLTDEMGDVLYSLCVLATAVNVDLDEALAGALAKYQKRVDGKNHAGSASSVENHD